MFNCRNRDACEGELNTVVWSLHLQKKANGEWRTDAVCIKVQGVPISDKQPEREMLEYLLAQGMNSCVILS